MRPCPAFSVGDGDSDSGHCACRPGAPGYVLKPRTNPIGSSSASGNSGGEHNRHLRDSVCVHACVRVYVCV